MADQGSPPPPQWRPLPTFPGLPQLFVAAVFGRSTAASTSSSLPAAAASYTIHVTDLATVWTESLDKKGILKRSLVEETSIDLIDADAEQWSVFLAKLGAAFDPGSPDHAGTSLTLAAGSGSG
ncbi:hypothetical protein Micbo1qcDRAFT_158335, partial [Microdochium bolleyi]